MSISGKTTILIAILSGLFLTAPPTLAQTIWYVDDDAVDDPCTGTPECGDPAEDGSPHHPFDQIQEAIDATIDGDTVLVADGTYTGPGNRDMDFGGKAITVRSENGPDSCVIDIQGSEMHPHRAFDFHSGETNASVVHGFRIRNGFMNSGGAVTASNSSPLFRSCVFQQNTAALGGAVALFTGAFAKFIECTFEGNTAGDAGGAIWIEGGLYSQRRLINCRFSDNVVDNNNEAVISAGIAQVELFNCLIAHNGAYGLRLGYFTSADMVNSTLAHNSGGIIALNVTPSVQIDNSIIWANSNHDLIDCDGCTLDIVNSDVAGGWAGEGNIDADPLFVDPDNGDFRLGPGSPCIDAGDNAAVPDGITTDLDGNLRLQNDIDSADTGNGNCPIVDMGSYEFPTTCPADIDCDESVGVSDLLEILANWGPCAACVADIDSDDRIGVTDLLMLLAAWGPCT